MWRKSYYIVLISCVKFIYWSSPEGVCYHRVEMTVCKGGGADGPPCRYDTSVWCFLISKYFEINLDIETQPMG